MYCIRCKNFYTIEKSFSRLFFIDKNYLCKKCINLYEYSLEYEAIPLTNKMLYKIKIYKRIQKEDIDFYILEYSKIIDKFFSYNKDIIIYDYINVLNDDILNILDNLFVNDIFLITFL